MRHRLQELIHHCQMYLAYTCANNDRVAQLYDHHEMITSQQSWTTLTSTRRTKLEVLDKYTVGILSANASDEIHIVRKLLLNHYSFGVAHTNSATNELVAARSIKTQTRTVHGPT